MRKLVFVLMAMIAAATFIRAYDNASSESGAVLRASLEQR